MLKNPLICTGIFLQKEISLATTSACLDNIHDWRTFFTKLSTIFMLIVGHKGVNTTKVIISTVKQNRFFKTCF